MLRVLFMALALKIHYFIYGGKENAPSMSARAGIGLSIVYILCIVSIIVAILTKDSFERVLAILYAGAVVIIILLLRRKHTKKANNDQDGKL